jgi:hypothetical protein
VTVTERRPTAANRVIGQPEESQRRDHSSSTFEQATAEDRPQEEKQIEVGSYSDPGENTGKQRMDAID